MKPTRVSIISILSSVLFSASLLLGLSPLSPALADFVCGNYIYHERGEEPPRPSPPKGKNWQAVTDTIYGDNVTFPKIFTIWTTWSPSSAVGCQWGEWQFERFAHLVIDNEPGEGDTLNYANRILRYFSEDAATEHDSIAIWTAVSDTAYCFSHFDIYFYDVAQHIHAGKGWLSLHCDGGDGVPETVERVIDFGFAHEWQHTCHTYYRRENTEEHSFGGFMNFDEFCSKLSEHKFGGGCSSSDNYDQPYERSLCGTRSYTENCYQYWYVDPDTAYCAESSGNGNHYYEWAMFGAYLDNAFTVLSEEQDLVFQWCRQNHTELDGGKTITVYDHNFFGLSQSISNLPVAYNDYFIEPGSRLNEVLHRYAVAKYFDLGTPQNNGEKLWQWHEPEDPQDPEENPIHPRDLYGLFEDRDGKCFTDIKTYPIYHYLDPDVHAGLSGWLCSDDMWPGEGTCEESCELDSLYPAMYKYRFVSLDDYAANYFVFVADEESSGRLNVTIEPTWILGCMECDASAPDGYSMNEYEIPDLSGRTLYCDVIGYTNLEYLPDERYHPLDIEGAHATILDSDTLTTITPDYDVSVDVDDFGWDQGEYNAAVVVLTMFHNDPIQMEGDYTTSTLPYQYRYMLIPDNPTYTSGLIQTNTTWSENSIVLIADSVVVGGSCTLTIDRGAKVFFTRDDAFLKAQDNGTIEVQGVEGNRVEFRAMEVDQPVAYWEGIQLEGHGALDCTHAEFRDIGSFSRTDSCVATIDSSTIIFHEDGAGAINITSIADTSATTTISNSLIYNVATIDAMWLDLENCTILQDLSVRGHQPEPEPLLTLNEGENHIESTELRFVERGIHIGNPPSGTPVELVIDEGTLLRGYDAEADATSLALYCAAKSDVEFHNSTMRETNTCADVNDGSLYVRDSNFVLEEGGTGFIGRGKTALLNLGDALVGGWNEIMPLPPLCVCLDDDTTEVCDSIVYMENLDKVATRIFYMNGFAPCFADSNTWGKCICPDEFFTGKSGLISWQYSISKYPCCGTSSPTSLIVAPQQDGPGIEVWPNPFSMEVSILLSPTRGEAVVEIDIFSVSGRKIDAIRKRIVGKTAITWNGRDHKGRRVASGIYFARIRTEGCERTEKLVLVR